MGLLMIEQNILPGPSTYALLCSDTKLFFKQYVSLLRSAALGLLCDLS